MVRGIEANPSAPFDGGCWGGVVLRCRVLVGARGGRLGAKAEGQLARPSGQNNSRILAPASGRIRRGAGRFVAG